MNNNDDYYGHMGKYTPSRHGRLAFVKRSVCHPDAPYQAHHFDLAVGHIPVLPENQELASGTTSSALSKMRTAIVLKTGRPRRLPAEIARNRPPFDVNSSYPQGSIMYCTPISWSHRLSSPPVRRKRVIA